MITQQRELICKCRKRIGYIIESFVQEKEREGKEKYNRFVKRHFILLEPAYPSVTANEFWCLSCNGRMEKNNPIIPGGKKK